MTQSLREDFLFYFCQFVFWHGFLGFLGVEKVICNCRLADFSVDENFYVTYTDSCYLNWAKDLGSFVAMFVLILCQLAKIYFV